MSNQSTAKIDQNNKGTLLAWNETTSNTEALKCDAVLDYLEVYTVANSGGTYTALNRAKIDGNENSTLLAYNETTGLVESLRCDNSGNLLVTIV